VDELESLGGDGCRVDGARGDDALLESVHVGGSEELAELVGADRVADLVAGQSVCETRRRS
jgi:hypothetical protein